MANLFEPEFDESSDRPGFQWRRARLAREAGGEHLGASLFELPPGQALYPMHYHLGNEELLHVTVDGREIVAIVDSSHRVRPGDVVQLRLPGEKVHLFNAETGMSMVRAREAAAA